METYAAEPVALLEDHSERDEVVLWRLRRLRAAGYGDEVAQKLAVRTDVDLHRAVDLVERGCPPDLAYEILA
jgi:hypothetical protein